MIKSNLISLSNYSNRIIGLDIIRFLAIFYVFWNHGKLLWEIRALEGKINDLSLQTSSKEYKLGKLLLAPIRFFQKLLKK